MREIIFRGKARYGGYLVTGVYINESYMLPSTGDDRITIGGEILNTVIEVIPETVGQFTGLKDCNGKMIFEGDVVKYAKGFSHWSGAYEKPTIVEYECGGFYPFAGEGEYAMNSDYAEIIGNIHDQKEDV